MTSSAPHTLRFPAAAPHETGAAAPLRMPGLDWLRAGAALAVVALHAGIPYMAFPLPALEWCVRSAEQSRLVDALCWGINVAVMPTFFLMGGALAAGVWNRNPGAAFLVHRSRRLLLPLAFAIAVVLPADMYVWLIGWYTQDLIPWKKVLSIKLPSPLNDQFWGVAHLWYLECLWTLSALAVLIQAGRARLLPSRMSHEASISKDSPLSHHVPAVSSNSAVGEGRGEGHQPTLAPLPQLSHSLWPARSLWSGLMTRPLRLTAGLANSNPQLPLILAAGLCLALDPTFLIGFQQAWWPGPAAIAFYGLFFAAGWRQSTGPRITRQPGLVIHLPSTPPANAEYRVLKSLGASPPRPASGRPANPRMRLLLAAGLFAGLLPQIHRHVESSFTGLNLVALTTAYAACGWLAATGLFTLARSIRSTTLPRPVAFAAAASFWMYLVHHPLVGLTQLALLNSTLPPTAKFLLSFATGVALSLASYAVFVRRTWIGRLLDGRGQTRPPTVPALPVREVPDVRRAA